MAFIRKEFMKVACTPGQKATLDDVGVMLIDGNIAQCAETFVDIIQTINPRYHNGFGPLSPTRKYIDNVCSTVDNSQAARELLSNVHEFSGVLRDMSVARVNNPSLKKEQLLELAQKKITGVDPLAFQASIELSVPDRKAKALGLETELLDKSVAYKLMFEEAKSNLMAMAADVDNDRNCDTQRVLLELLKIDAIMSLDDTDIHNRFTGERLNGELLKDRIDILYAENAKLMSCVGASLSESIAALRYRHIAQFLKLNPIKNGVIQVFGKTVPVMLADGKRVTTIETLEKAIDQILSTPMGPFASQVLKHFEPSDVNTVLGTFPAVYMDSTIRKQIGPTNDSEWTTVRDSGDDGELTMTTKLVDIVSQWIEDILDFYKKYQTVLGNVGHLQLGWQMLKFAPVSARGSWRDFFEESPLMFSRTNWSLPVSDPLEAGFMMRLQPYTEENQFGLTREEHVIYRVKGTNLSHVGLRGTTYPIQSLIEDISIHVARNDLTNIHEHAVYEYELNRYEPYERWAGEGGVTYKERSISVAAISRVIGVSVEQTRKEIEKNSARYGKFFNISPTGDISVKQNVNPVWATWIEQSSRTRMLEVKIPYFGSTMGWLRVGPEVWTTVTTQSQFTCTQDDESMGFEVSNLITGGSLDFREAK
jgi:hypothetical protein